MKGAASLNGDCSFPHAFPITDARKSAENSEDRGSALPSVSFGEHGGARTSGEGEREGEDTDTDSTGLVSTRISRLCLTGPSSGCLSGRSTTALCSRVAHISRLFSFSDRLLSGSSTVGMGDDAREDATEELAKEELGEGCAAVVVASGPAPCPLLWLSAGPAQALLSGCRRVRPELDTGGELGGKRRGEAALSGCRGGKSRGEERRRSWRD